MSDKSIYEVLSTVDMSKKIEIVQQQKYISWAKQWAELLKYYPESTFKIHENEVGDPFTVSVLGIMVKVSVTIEGLTRTLNYPLLNTANKSLKLEAYTYQVKEYVNKKPTGKMIDKYVDPANTFDVNTAHMRALTKCIALFGLTLYIYKKEMNPEIETVDSKQLQEITNKIKEKGMKIADVTTAWNLPSLAKLHAVNFDNFMNWMDDNK